MIAIARAYDIKRLMPEEQIALHVKERNLRYCLAPFEIATIFKVPPIKIAYMIPDIDAAQATQKARLTALFHSVNLFPKYEYLNWLSVDLVHEFDERVNMIDLDLVYSGARKVKLRDSLGDE